VIKAAVILVGVQYCLYPCADYSEPAEVFVSSYIGFYKPPDMTAAGTSSSRVQFPHALVVDEEVMSDDASVAGKAANIVQLVVDDLKQSLAEFLQSLQEEDVRKERPGYFVTHVLDKADERGWRPIHHAFHLRRYDCAKLLIDADEDSRRNAFAFDVIKSYASFSYLS
jgi:hypothetical protein